MTAWLRSRKTYLNRTSGTMSFGQTQLRWRCLAVMHSISRNTNQLSDTVLWSLSRPWPPLCTKLFKCEATCLTAKALLKLGHVLQRVKVHIWTPSLCKERWSKIPLQWFEAAKVHNSRHSCWRWFYKLLIHRLYLVFYTLFLHFGLVLLNKQCHVVICCAFVHLRLHLPNFKIW